MAREWPLVALREICDLFDGPHQTAPQTPDGPVVYLNVGDIRRGRIHLELSGRVSFEVAREWSRRVTPEPGDVVFGYEATVGQAAVLPNSQRWCLGRRVGLLRPHRDRVEPRFLAYAWYSPSFQETLRANRIRGSTVESIRLTDLPSWQIRLPSLDEQRSIVEVLGSLDDRIELNRRVSGTLEAMMRALFESWLVAFDPVRAKASGQHPRLPSGIADLFPDRFATSELGAIPAGWRPSALGVIAEQARRGIRPDEIESGTPYIALEHMPRRSVVLDRWAAADGLESGKSQFRRGEILFGKLRPYFQKVGVAPIDGVCSTDIVVVRPVSDDWFGIVMSTVSSDAFVQYASAGSTGTKMPRTSWAEMARFPMPLPPAPIAAALNETVWPSIDRIIASVHENRTLAAVRDALLPKLVSGEMRVVEAERVLKAAPI
jgi:type I restriction enzyme S subunit